MTLLDHINTETTKKLDFKNSHLTSVGAIYLNLAECASIQVKAKYSLGTPITHRTLKASQF
jgi:hypothetical protein